MSTQPLDVQYGGDHYKDCAIQPTVYIDKNKIPFSLGCTIKYCTRAGKKGNMDDLLKDMLKARHFIALYMQINHNIDIVAEEQRLAELEG